MVDIICRLQCEHAAVSPVSPPPNHHCTQKKDKEKSKKGHFMYMDTTDATFM